MKKTAGDRIVDAIIFGARVHPLAKRPCAFCPAWICEKDTEDHLEAFHADMSDRNVDDEYDERSAPEFTPMFSEEQSDERSHREFPDDEEIDGMYQEAQSDSEAYRIAH